MGTFRYSEWDGTQDIFEPEADSLMSELERSLMNHGDLSYALRQLQRGGLQDSQGRRLPSIQDLLQRLRQRREQQLDKYNLGSVMKDIQAKLDNILKTERTGIERRRNDARDKAKSPTGDLPQDVRERLLKTMEEMAAEHLAKLDALPKDPGGLIRELSQYDFMDEDARRQFEELMDMLKKHALQSYARDLVNQFQNMDPGAMASVRNLLEAINQMLEQRLRGEEPDFAKFMEQFGDFFGPNPPQDLDELIERLQDQIAQARSLLDSLSPEDRRQLEEIMDSMMDEATKMELAKMANALEQLLPSDDLRKQYPFRGRETISYDEALKLMEKLQKMDELEEQLKDSQYSRSLETVNDKLVKELMGNESAEELERLRSINKVLEDAGYIRYKDGQYELTPRGMRKIGQRALEDIFAQLRKDRSDGHRLITRGIGGERVEETKRFEFGDDFDLHLQRSIMNTLQRSGQRPPVRMRVDDFEVYRTEAAARSATVLMLDLSLSMPMRGNFQAAKKVAVALDNLIRTQYPKDSLYIVGFSSYARRIKKETLAMMNWDEFDPYTNMQHGFFLARQILAKEQCSNRQIILISDGEPTAHFEGEQIYFQYPPSMRTLQITLREVRRCTQTGITINTFMLESGRFLGAFITQMARINKGRVFFTNADSLGQYLLVDYIDHKHKRV